MRTINSPGVQITEKDLSLRVNSPVGTTVFVPGFAQQGPIGEPIQITTASELEAIFGVPTNAAERYFYYSCREILNSPAQLLCARLPYGEDAGTTHSTKQYSALFYPMASGLSLEQLLATGEEVIEWKVGAPRHFTLSYQEYQALLQNNFNWHGTSANPTFVKALVDDNGNYLTFLNEHDFDNIESFASNYDGLELTSVLSGIPAYFDATAQARVLAAFPDYTTTTTTLVSSLDLSGNVVEEEVTEVTTIFDTNGVDLIEGAGTVALSAQTVQAGMIILNDIQSSINELGEGFYVGFADNFEVYVDSPDYTSVNQVVTVTSLNGGYSPIPDDRFDFALSATKLDSDQGVTSVSESLEKVGFVGFASNLYRDHLSLGVFRIRRSTVDPTRLSLGTTERYLGSFDSNRKQVNPNGGQPQNAYLEDMINNGSPGIRLSINPSVSRNFDWTVGSFGTEPVCRVSVDNTAKKLFPLGVFIPDTRITEKTKMIGNIPLKLDKILRYIETPENVLLDVVVDAGLSTIFATTWTEELSGKTGFNDQQFVDLYKLDKNDKIAIDKFYQESWQSVIYPLINFAENTRKDCMAIIDPPRHIFVNGRDSKTLDQEEKNFTQHIYDPLRRLASVESNYGAMYGNWIKINDIYSGRRFWHPTSGYAAAVFARNDAVTQPWYAPAGLNRGTFDCLDIAFNPNQKQRDRLYEISVNPIVFFNGDGHVVMGQKTLQVKPTAFDRINVRRLFLTLERAVGKTVKYFVFEPNTQATRARLVNTIAPIFQFAKNNEGLYDYLIVCDDRNNTPDTIDNNELIVDIYLKPVKAAEFILINFIATRTGQDFSELI